MPTCGKPAIRTPAPCGLDDWLAYGREPSQMGWYEFVALRHRKGERILDVGCGMGVGVAFMNHFGCNAIGYDTDIRLAGRPLTLQRMLYDCLPADFYDVVTCIDVIEHVVDDVPFMEELKAIARKAVYVSTPNFARSKAKNEHHAREYTIGEFAEAFKPDEIWVSYPDGWYMRQRLPWPCAENHGAPDGHEWPHFCGVFYV